MYDGVLFPTDGSESAEAAFEHGLDLATRYDARIHVLYVVNTTYSDVGASGDTTIDSLRERGESVVREAGERTTAKGVDAVARIEGGDPYKRLIEYSGANVDPLVMGTRGRSGIDRYPSGSSRKPIGFSSQTERFAFC